MSNSTNYCELQFVQSLKLLMYQKTDTKHQNLNRTLYRNVLRSVVLCRIETSSGAVDVAAGWGSGGRRGGGGRGGGGRT